MPLTTPSTLTVPVASLGVMTLSPVTGLRLMAVVAPVSGRLLGSALGPGAGIGLMSVARA